VLKQARVFRLAAFKPAQAFKPAANGFSHLSKRCFGCNFGCGKKIAKGASRVETPSVGLLIQNHLAFVVLKTRLSLVLWTVTSDLEIVCFVCKAVLMVPDRGLLRGWVCFTAAAAVDAAAAAPRLLLSSNGAQQVWGSTAHLTPSTCKSKLNFTAAAASCFQLSGPLPVPMQPFASLLHSCCTTRNVTFWPTFSALQQPCNDCDKQPWYSTLSRC
jgi:hypothetical protein